MTAREECEELMNDLLPFAKQMLAEHGEFYPFGGYMRDDGSIVHCAGEVEGTDQPLSADLIRVLKDSFKKLAVEGAGKCFAIVFDVLIRRPGEESKRDAIQVNLDHREGDSSEVLFPYNINEDGSIEYVRVFAQRGKREIFGDAEVR